jgi:hypothetical protein
LSTARATFGSDILEKRLNNILVVPVSRVMQLHESDSVRSIHGEDYKVVIVNEGHSTSRGVPRHLVYVLPERGLVYVESTRHETCHVQ